MHCRYTTVHATRQANNLAVTLQESAGDSEGALKLMEEVLGVRRRKYSAHCSLRIAFCVL